jgi:hypothetical protein
MADIREYRVAVSRAKIERLKQKLNHSDFPDELNSAGWDYGSPLGDVRRIAEYWKTQYRWEDTEAQINRLPNFMATLSIEGFDPVDVHFLHRKSRIKNAIPLVFVHGCQFPSSSESFSRRTA